MNETIFNLYEILWAESLMQNLNWDTLNDNKNVY